MRLNAFLILVRAVSMETSLYYYRARYYDPSAGRFLGEDPIRFVGSGFNFYAYAGNAAANFIDPSGLDPSLWQRFVNWLWPSPASSTTNSPKCSPTGPSYVPPWIPGKQFNKFNTGPSSGPYRPPSSPQAPDGPINPTEPSPTVEPPPPGGLPETIPPTPFIRPSPAPEMIPGFSRVAAMIEAIINALSELSDPVIVVRPTCEKGCT